MRTTERRRLKPVRNPTPMVERSDPQDKHFLSQLGDSLEPSETRAGLVCNRRTTDQMVRGRPVFKIRNTESIVFQLRVVAGAPNSSSMPPR